MLYVRMINKFYHLYKINITFYKQNVKQKNNGLRLVPLFLEISNIKNKQQNVENQSKTATPYCKTISLNLQPTSQRSSITAVILYTRKSRFCKKRSIKKFWFLFLLVLLS